MIWKTVYHQFSVTCVSSNSFELTFSVLLAELAVP